MTTDFAKALGIIISLMEVMPMVPGSGSDRPAVMDMARQFLREQTCQRSEVTIEKEMLSALKGIVESFHESVRTDEALSEFPSLKRCIDAIARAEGAAR